IWLIVRRSFGVKVVSSWKLLLWKHCCCPQQVFHSALAVHGAVIKSPCVNGKTNCAKWRRESVPVRLREKGFEALMLFLFFCTDLHFGGRISFVCVFGFCPCPW